MNVIVERQTVDWLATTVQQAAATFASAVHGQDAGSEQFRSTVRAISLWDETFATSFFRCRGFLRQLAHENWSRVRACDRIFQQRDYGELADGFFGGASGWALFTDDDDWYAPEVFEALDGLHSGTWVAIWPRSRFDGRLESLPVGPEPLLCYTNNYAVSARAAPRGAVIPDLMQHFEADQRVKSSQWAYTTVEEPLSVTNKSPCSRNYLDRAMAADSPHDAIHASVARYVQEDYDLPARLVWAESWISRSRAFFKDVLKTRR